MPPVRAPLCHFRVLIVIALPLDARVSTTLPGWESHAGLPRSSGHTARLWALAEWVVWFLTRRRCPDRVLPIRLDGFCTHREDDSATTAAPKRKEDRRAVLPVRARFVSHPAEPWVPHLFRLPKPQAAGSESIFDAVGLGSTFAVPRC